jgi:hypothetical protein
MEEQDKKKEANSLYSVTSNTFRQNTTCGEQPADDCKLLAEKKSLIWYNHPPNCSLAMVFIFRLKYMVKETDFPFIMIN